MNVVEVSEKNLKDAIDIFKRLTAPLYEAVPMPVPDDNELESILMGYESGAISYMLADKGKAYALFTVNKDNAEIENFCVDDSACSDAAINKTLEFAIKQFSAITLVFTWVDSLNTKLSEILENYGFEYTGEQDYLNKDKFISRFHYVYRRKK